MSPETLIIDRQFRGVGRIKRATGTTIVAVRTRMSRMLTTLFREGRLDILRAIRDGDLTLMEVYNAYQQNTLHTLAIGDTLPDVGKAMRSWEESVRAEYSKEHARAIRKAIRRLEGVRKGARVAELPKLLEQLRKTTTHPRAFNLTRAVALGFVRQTLKKSHPLWIEIAAIEPRKTKKRAPAPAMTVDQARVRFPAPQSNPIDASAWGMLTTGMGPKEYWGAWHVQSDRVHIEGTKREGRVRDVPLVQAPAVPTLSRVRFEKRFRERFHGTITPYDLRRTYARWMEEAGIPRTRRRLYMGHGVKDVTDLYERSEISSFLVEDARKLSAFLAATHEKSHDRRVSVVGRKGVRR